MDTLVAMLIWHLIMLSAMVASLRTVFIQLQLSNVLVIKFQYVIDMLQYY
jgi:hypothetical protein